MVVQIPPVQLSTANDEKHSIFQFPNSEIKGMLSDTFEIDNTIDAKSLSIDDISREINKE